MNMTPNDSSQLQPKHKKENSKRPDWYPVLAEFRNRSNRKAMWQLANSLLPYLALWYVMIRSLELQHWYFVTPVLVLPAAAFLVRIFVLFHDCVHGSLFSSSRANGIIGKILGVLVFTSFEDWRFSHLKHHAGNSNLDSRGFGDIWLMTLKEYEAASTWKRALYRLYRNPLVLIGFGPLYIFLVRNRIPTHQSKRKQHINVHLTTVFIVLLGLLAAYLIGWQAYVLIQLPVIWLAGAAGLWLFYVQHQFERGYWAHKCEWEPLKAAMEGSSYYRLPAVLRWFSGNIGYHHVHHLSPGIPNYQLKKCHDAVPALQEKKPLSLLQSLTCVRLKIWDEEEQRMTGFPEPARQ